MRRPRTDGDDEDDASSTGIRPARARNKHVLPWPGGAKTRVSVPAAKCPLAASRAFTVDEEEGEVLLLRVRQDNHDEEEDAVADDANVYVRSLKVTCMDD